MEDLLDVSEGSAEATSVGEHRADVAAVERDAQDELLRVVSDARARRAVARGRTGEESRLARSAGSAEVNIGV